MIKKWSYVVATVAAVFGGSILTGCIDNDEPFGITQIRVETANLLKAKQALVAADAAAKQAQAELDKANAEIAKINAEIAKAQAESAIKIAELEAEARAALTQAQAEEAQARADYQKAQTEAYIAEQKAKLDNLIADNELKIKNSQLQYDQLLYQWELTKLNLSNTASSTLYQAVESAYTTYIEELAAYNAKAEELTKQQRLSAQWLNDLMYDESAQAWTHPKDKFKKTLETEIENQEKTIADAQDAIKTYEDKIAEVEDFQTNSDVYTMWSEYTQKIKDNQAKMAELEIEYKNIQLANQPLYNEVGNLWEKYQAVGNEEIAIPAYTFVPTAEVAALGMNEMVIVPEDQSYTLNSVMNGSSLYYFYMSRYQTYIGNFKKYLLDENDVLWTTARVNEMTRQKDEAQKVFDVANAGWENAKAVYNMGNEVKASELPLEAEVETAVNAFNTKAETLSTAKENIAQLRDAFNEASEVLDEALNNGSPLNQEYKDAIEACDKAKEEAQAAYNEAANKAMATRDQAIADAQKAVDNAWAAYDRAVKECGAIQGEIDHDPENATLKENLKNAETTRDSADEAYQKAVQDFPAKEGKANSDCDKAVAAANTQMVKAINKAEEDLETAETKWVAAGGNNADLKPLQENKDKAESALNEAIAALDPVGDEMKDLIPVIQEAIANQLSEIKLPYWAYSSIPQDYQVDSYISSIIYNWDMTLPVAEAPITYVDNEGVYVNAKDYLIKKSHSAYGNLGFPYNSPDYNGSNNHFEFDEAFLVDEVTTEMLNAYVKSYCKFNYNFEPEDYQCYQYYKLLFGDFGQVKYLENRIVIAKAYIANSDLMKTVTGTLEENLQSLLDSFDKAKEEEKEAYEAYDAKREEYAQLYADIASQANDLRGENILMNNVVIAINNNFSLLNDLGAVSPEAIKGAVDYFNVLISNENKTIATAENALKEAQNNLTLLENGNAEYDYNPYASQIELLTAQLAASKDKLDLIKERLEELQAKYESAASKQ